MGLTYLVPPNVADTREVSEENANLADPISAYNSITDASVTNPYVIHMNPGIYSIAVLTMKEYVSLVADDPRAVIIEVDDADAVIAADNSRLEGVTIRLINTTISRQAIVIADKSPEINNVWLETDNGSVLDIAFGVTTGSPKIYSCLVKPDASANNFQEGLVQTGAGGAIISDCSMETDGNHIEAQAGTITSRKNTMTGAGTHFEAGAGGTIISDEDLWSTITTPLLGTFYDITDAELYTCIAGDAANDACYISADDTVAQADNTAGTPLPADAFIVYKPSATTCYAKKHGAIFAAVPAPAWVAGVDMWLGTSGDMVTTPPAGALQQRLGVCKNTTEFIIDVQYVEISAANGLTKDMPIAFDVGTSMDGTHTDGNSLRSCKIIDWKGMDAWSQKIRVPDDFLSDGQLYVDFFPTTTGTVDWTTYASMAKTGEDEATHSATTTANAQAVTDDQMLSLLLGDSTDILAGISAGDMLQCQFTIDIFTTTTQIMVVGFHLAYTGTP